MVFSAVSGISGPVAAVQTVPKPDTLIPETPNSSKKEVINDNTNVEQYVRTYFKDIPVMIKIALCESRFRQFDKNGDVFRGAYTPKDVGVMQINEDYHGDQAVDGNYNIYTVEGNTAYARALYNDMVKRGYPGMTPWNSSKKCWANMDEDASASSQVLLASANLK